METTRWSRQDTLVFLNLFSTMLITFGAAIIGIIYGIADSPFDTFFILFLLFMSVCVCPYGLAVNHLIKGMETKFIKTDDGISVVNKIEDLLKSEDFDYKRYSEHNQLQQYPLLLTEYIEIFKIEGSTYFIKIRKSKRLGLFVDIGPMTEQNSDMIENMKRDLDKFAESDA
jgi:hypothetical protein